MTITSLSLPGGLKKRALFFPFFVLAAMVFAVLPLSARLPVNALLSAHAGLTALLLLTALSLRRSQVGKAYWQVVYVLFVAGVAILSSTLFSGSLVAFHFPSSPQWIAVAKFSESLCRVVPILALMAIIGADGRSMYLARRLGLGLAVGLAGFVAFAGLAFIPQAGKVDMASKLLSLSPWILIFVLANGFMEELLFRGLFLKSYEPFLGRGLSNLLTAMVFTLAHLPVTYVSDVVQFLVILFPLALLWGYLMQKTDSLWGSACLTPALTA